MEVYEVWDPNGHKNIAMELDERGLLVAVVYASGAAEALDWVRETYQYDEEDALTVNEAWFWEERDCDNV